MPAHHYRQHQSWDGAGQREPSQEASSKQAKGAQDGHHNGQYEVVLASRTGSIDGLHGSSVRLLTHDHHVTGALIHNTHTRITIVSGFYEHTIC